MHKEVAITMNKLALVKAKFTPKGLNLTIGETRNCSRGLWLIKFLPNVHYFFDACKGGKNHTQNKAPFS